MIRAVYSYQVVCDECGVHECVECLGDERPLPPGWSVRKRVQGTYEYNQELCVECTGES